MNFHNRYAVSRQIPIEDLSHTGMVKELRNACLAENSKSNATRGFVRAADVRDQAFMRYGLEMRKAGIDLSSSDPVVHSQAADIARGCRDMIVKEINRGKTIGSDVSTNARFWPAAKAFTRAVNYHQYQANALRNPQEAAPSPRVIPATVRWEDAMSNPHFDGTGWMPGTSGPAIR